MKKIIGVFALAVSLMLTGVACDSSDSTDDTTATTTADATNPETDPVTDPATQPETDPETDPETEPAETEPEDILDNMNEDLRLMTTPFWKSNTMYRESASMILRADGTITAKLAFKPTRIIKVEDNTLTKVYEEGKDYTWDGETNVLTWVEGSSILFFTENDLHGLKEDGTPFAAYGSYDDQGRSQIGNSLYCNSQFLYQRQVNVTYEYNAADWTGTQTAYQGTTLAKTMAKLQAGEPVNIVFFGDSIFTGCDTSGNMNIAPHQPSFPTFIEQVLEEVYGSEVTVYNPSVGGKTAEWGAESAQSLLLDSENAIDADLIFLGFGMNDAYQAARTTCTYVTNIIDTVRAANSDCEFVVVTPMVANADSGFLGTQGQLATVYGRLLAPYSGVGFVDMFSCHQKLLETKDYMATSGNGVNHPNDWLARVYTMQLISTLVDYQ